MKTELICVDNNIEETYQKAGEIIKSGGLVAFPTETVYGLGGDALNPNASKKIYAAKGRPSDNPLIVHVSRIEDVYKIVKNVDERAELLMKKFWPGPLTIIFEKNELVPYETTGGLDTVAIRMPNNKCALEFISASGGYIAAPSANSSGRPSPTTAMHVAEDLDGKIEMILDGGECRIGVESSIIDVSSDIPTVLRPGFVTLDDLKEVLGDVLVDPAILGITDDGQKPKAPGMKYRHYAPKGDMYIVTGNTNEVIEKINQLSKESLDKGYKVGIIASEETVSYYKTGVVRSIGSLEDEESIARHLYSVLREFDTLGMTMIYSEEFDTPALGMAIMNRLMKAAGKKIINV